MADVTIYHNPACGTSRNVLALIGNSGVEPTIVEYLKMLPARGALVDISTRPASRLRDAVRTKGTPCYQLGLDDSGLSDNCLLGRVLEHPIPINRPFVITPRVRLCRPSEVVFDILQLPQKGPFRKEDGELVVDASGIRVR